MAGSWSYTPGDQYKPTDELIEKLVDIVSKGGNFLLNIGPGPDGTLAPDAYDRVKGMGDYAGKRRSYLWHTHPDVVQRRRKRAVHPIEGWQNFVRLPVQFSERRPGTNQNNLDQRRQNHHAWKRKKPEVENYGTGCVHQLASRTGSCWQTRLGPKNQPITCQ